MLLQSFYTDILHCYSYVSKGEFAPFYIKHLTAFDLAEVEQASYFYSEEAKKSQIPTIEEKCAELIKENLWTKDKDREIKDKEDFVTNLKLSKSKQLAQKMIDQFGAEISKIEQEIFILKIEKQSLMGFTVDSYVNKRLSDFCVSQFLFKNATLKELLFTDDEFNDLNNEDINNLINEYKKNSDNFNTKNLQKIALSSFFLNFFYLCENNPLTFYGVNVAYLTLYQSELFSYGIRFKNILSELRGKVDDAILSDPEKLLEYYDRGKNVDEIIEKINKDGNEGGTLSMPGLTADDYKKAGIATEVIDFKAIAKKKGKDKLDIYDMMEIQNSN